MLKVILLLAGLSIGAEIDSTKAPAKPDSVQVLQVYQYRTRGKDRQIHYYVRMRFYTKPKSIGYNVYSGYEKTEQKTLALAVNVSQCEVLVCDAQTILPERKGLIFFKVCAVGEDGSEAICSAPKPFVYTGAPDK